MSYWGKIGTLIGGEIIIGSIAAASGWLTSFVMPIKHFLVFVFVLVLFDLLTGINAAKSRKESVSSRRLGRTVTKIIHYSIAILASEGMRYVFVPVVPVTWVTAFVISLTEFKSLIENVESVTGVDLWKSLQNQF